MLVMPIALEVVTPFAVVVSWVPKASLAATGMPLMVPITVAEPLGLGVPALVVAPPQAAATTSKYPPIPKRTSSSRLSLAMRPGPGPDHATRATLLRR